MDISKKYLSISQFARISRASAKSLRYYDEIGLFSPAFTDPDTGYRYYNVNQIYDLNLVRFCIEEGIPTEEIKQRRRSGTLVDARGFFRQCLETSKERLREAYATTLRMEAYNDAYLEQISDDMLEDGRAVKLPTLALVTTPLSEEPPNDYNRYLGCLTHLLLTAHDAGFVPLAHQGVLRSKDGHWHAFINVSDDTRFGTAPAHDQANPDTDNGLASMRLRSATYKVASFVGADVERCFAEAFRPKENRTPKLVLEAWAYATFLNIPAFNAHYT